MAEETEEGFTAAYVPQYLALGCANEQSGVDVLIHRRYKYRIYPTPEQEVTLLRWEGVLRFLWNLGLEQWHLWMSGHVPVKYQRADHLLKADGVTDADIPPLTDAEWAAVEWSHSRHPDASRFGRTQHAIGCRNPDCKRQCLAGDPEAPRTRTLTSIYPSAMGQNKELTDLRAEHDWIAEVPRNVCESLFFDLEAGWKQCFERGSPPRWKRRGDAVGLCEPHGRVFKVEKDHVTFPKLGKIRAVIHRPLGGKQKAITITRDADQWYASVLCEVEVADPVPSAKPAVGIDRGVVNVVADSDGRLIENPKHRAKMQARIARANRALRRQKEEGKNREKARVRLAKLHRKVRRQREHFLHVESKRYAKSHGVIVFEKLNLEAMTRSAAGTAETPGKNVRQKTGLNREMNDAGLGTFARFVKYKVVPEGGEVREVWAAYSSQECHGCGHVAAENRPDQATFCCVRCGLVEHADTNAAKVILARGLKLPAVEPTVAACRGPATRHPKKQETRPARTRRRPARAT
jgi:putative transposase